MFRQKWSCFPMMLRFWNGLWHAVADERDDAIPRTERAGGSPALSFDEDGVFGRGADEFAIGEV